jgi:hypothetical protein
MMPGTQCPEQNPRSHDDTGWSLTLLRNLKVHPVDDKSIFDKPMALAATDFKGVGTVTGSGSTLVIDHTTDNTLATFRFANARVKMSAAEQAFELGGHKFGPGAFIIPNADRAALDPQIRDSGLTAWATNTPPKVPMHDLDVPMAIHSRANPGRRLGADGVRQSQGALHAFRVDNLAAGNPARSST